MRILLGFVLICAIIVSGVFFYYNKQFNRIINHLDDTNFEFTIDKGNSIKEIAFKLQQEDLIKSRFHLVAQYRIYLVLSSSCVLIFGLENKNKNFLN